MSISLISLIEKHIRDILTFKLIFFNLFVSSGNFFLELEYVHHACRDFFEIIFELIWKKAND